MKTAVLTTAVGVGTASAMVADLHAIRFTQWQAEHGVTYATSDEEMHRFSVFKDNALFVEEHNANADEHGFTVGLNRFADMSNDEYRAMLTLSGPAPDMDVAEVYAPSDIELESNPTEVDWRTGNHSLVTPVKNQGQCGSCWAFSTVASLEGQYAKKTGNLTSLAESQLVDCSRLLNHGCNGGLMTFAFNYIKYSKHGMALESSYPYHPVQQHCDTARFEYPSPPATVSKHVGVKKHSESDLETATANVGPVSVAIDASHQSFQLYHSGVYNEKACSRSHTDHGVTVVGYGVDDKDGDYWLVKNSWSTSWGDKGYIKMAKGENDMCGIASSACYPVV